MHAFECTAATAALSLVIIAAKPPTEDSTSNNLRRDQIKPILPRRSKNLLQAGIPQYTLKFSSREGRYHVASNAHSCRHQPEEIKRDFNFQAARTRQQREHTYTSEQQRGLYLQPADLAVFPTRPRPPGCFLPPLQPRAAPRSAHLPFGIASRRAKCRFTRVRCT